MKPQEIVNLVYDELGKVLDNYPEIKVKVLQLKMEKLRISK